MTTIQTKEQRAAAFAFAAQFLAQLKAQQDRATVDAIREMKLISWQFEPMSDEDILKAWRDRHRAEAVVRDWFAHAVKAKDEMLGRDEWLEEHAKRYYGWFGLWYGFEDPDDAFHFKMRFG